jgi:hypothetical protein
MSVLKLKKTKVTFTGGFHNSGAISVLIQRSPMTVEDYWKSGQIFAILSDRQIKRLDRHFCGVSGCKCGGLLRAMMVVIK